MGFSLDNVVQQDTGSFEGTSGTVSLPAGTTAGNAVLIIAGMGGSNVQFDVRNITTPTGFTAVTTRGETILYATLFAWIRTSASAGETSWTLSLTGGSEQVCWSVFEVSNLDSDWPDKVYLNASPTLVGSPVSSVTSNSASSETMAGVAVVGFFATNTTPSAPTLSSYTNGFYEIAAVSRSNASRAHQLTVAAKAVNTVSTVDCTAAVAPDSYAVTWLMVLTGADSHHAPNITAMSGFEVGTATNLAVTAPGINTGTMAPWDAVTGSPAIVATSARSGSYCLELSSTAAAENVTWIAGTAKNLSGTTAPVWSERFHIYFPTSLPAGDVPLASVEAGSLGNGVVIRYVSASQKIGVQIGSGTEQLSDAAVTADKWIGIDYLYDPRATTHTCQWAVDYDASLADTTDSVIQTTASTAGLSANAVSTVRKGWTTAISATVRYDDIVGSRFRKTYPIGDVRIQPLKVDPAGTPTVSGSSTNFRTFTSNGTLATWTAAGTRTALDDIPPTIGAAADGLTQITNAVTEYVEVPMESFTLAPNYAPVAGRWYWAGWAASGNPATFKFQPYDGTAPNFGIYGDTVDAGFDDTSLVWMSLVHNRSAALNSFYQLTQARLDALAARFGFAEDTNPDAGVHAVLFELAIQPAVSVGIISAEAGDFNVYAKMHLYSGAIVSLLATTPVAGTRGGTLTWTVDGVAGSQYVNPNSSHEQSLGGVDVASVTQVGFIPDPVE